MDGLFDVLGNGFHPFVIGIAVDRFGGVSIC